MKLTTDRYEASSSLFATAELLVLFTTPTVVECVVMSSSCNSNSNNNSNNSDL